MGTPVLTKKEKRKKLKDNNGLTKGRVSVIVSLTDFVSSPNEIYLNFKGELETLEEDFEILFVDDGGTDQTWSLLKTLVDEEANVRAVRLRTSSGDAAAFEAGLKHTNGEVIVYMTGRKRINPAGIHTLLKKLHEGYDLVMGWRYHRGDSRLNQIISKSFNWLVKKVYRLNLHDINSGIFVAKRRIFEEVPIYGDMNIFLPVLAERKGYKVSEAQVEQLPGTFRQSKFVSEYIQRLLDLITVIFLIDYSKKPIHFLGFLGLIFTLAGAAMNLYLFLYRILSPYGIAGRPLLLLGSLLLVIGIQMISIGLIGEIIIFTHAREFQDYSIEEIIE